jgi:RimJ/RimL family protein N-acetyltransferase
MPEFTSLTHTDLRELTEAWNRCWEGYPYRSIYSEANMSAWLSQCQVDLDYSVAIREAGRVIAFSLLGTEKDEGWIAGTSIDPEFRGRRLFAPLMLKQLQRADELGLQQIQLEVLTQNHALKVYQAVGFRFWREVNVYRLPAGTVRHDFRHSSRHLYQEVALADYFQARAASGFSPTWQRRETYLRRYSTLHGWMNTEGSSGFLLGGEQGSTLLDAWCFSAQEAEVLIDWILSKTTGELNLTNQPKDWISALLTRLNLQPTVTQYEMICPLAKHSLT